MIVECPRCKARYRVDEGVVAEEPTFKCSRCDHLFGHEAAPTEATEPERETEPETPSPSLDEPADPEADAGLSCEPDPEQEPTHGASSRGARRRGERSASENLDLPFATSPAGTAEDDPEDDRWRDEDPSLDFRDDQEDEADEEKLDEDDESYASAREPHVSDGPRFLRGFAPEEPPAGSDDRLRRPFLVFLAVLVLFYGNLALYLRNHVPTTERALAGIPLFGRVLVEDRLLQSRVYLRDLEGVFHRVKDGRTVFIVSGRAVNTADTAVRGVEVESALYDAEGASIATKSIFCGNAMSLKIVKDLSSKEITILQRLQPPQRFEIAPGDAAGFSVVFLDPPESLVEFSARVASAQPALS